MSNYFIPNSCRSTVGVPTGPKLIVAWLELGMPATRSKIAIVLVSGDSSFTALLLHENTKNGTYDLLAVKRFYCYACKRHPLLAGRTYKHSFIGPVKPASLGHLSSSDATRLSASQVSCVVLVYTLNIHDFVGKGTQIYKKNMQSGPRPQDSEENKS